jgi:hypothetical protein
MARLYGFNPEWFSGYQDNDGEGKRNLTGGMVIAFKLMVSGVGQIDPGSVPINEEGEVPDENDCL